MAAGDAPGGPPTVTMTVRGLAETSVMPVGRSASAGTVGLVAGALGDGAVLSGAIAMGLEAARELVFEVTL